MLHVVISLVLRSTDRVLSTATDYHLYSSIHISLGHHVTPTLQDTGTQYSIQSKQPGTIIPQTSNIPNAPSDTTTPDTSILLDSITPPQPTRIPQSTSTPRKTSKPEYLNRHQHHAKRLNYQILLH